MVEKLKILAISGSTRSRSSNLNLIKAISDISTNVFDITLFEGLLDMPQFNPDVQDEPQQITNFKQQLRSADGVLICTPEYAIGVPGTLKNAIDWTVSTMDFSQKPVALITASTSGEVAHRSLLGTLLIIESRIVKDAQFVIPFISTKVNAEAKITDAAMLDKVTKLIHSFAAAIKGEAADGDYLPAPILING